jgi:hypothetical protein
MKWTPDRIVSVATLVASLVAIVLVLKRPQPVAAPVSPAAQAANAQSFETKIEQLEKPTQLGQPQVEVHLSADELRAALAEAAKTIPAAAVPQTAQRAVAQASVEQSGAAAQSGGVVVSPQLAQQEPSASGPDAAFAPGEADVKDYQLSFEGDLAKGQFLTEIAGKPVWVTLEGHLASKDGYATFDPTEFKVGDLEVPVSLVNDALQKKLGEQRDKLKLPDNVGGFKVENGEMVLTQR